jgi:hypothetical protein
MNQLTTKIIFALIFSAILSACADDDGNNSCVPDGNAACPAIFAPVCVQNQQGAFCNEGNQCAAEAKCETVLCGLDLDISQGGIIDPDTDCAKAYPGCLNACL